MKTKHLIAGALFTALACTATSLVAQSATNTVGETNSVKDLERPPYRPWTLGVGIGTDSIFGGGVSWRFSDHLGTRVGVGYSETSWNDLGIAGLKYDVKLRLLDEPLTLDVYPWRKSSFHFSLGMFLNQNELSGSVSSTGTIIVDGQPVEIRAGSLAASIKQQPVNPYLGIGGNLFYFDRAHHWAMSGELGVAFTGNPTVSLDRTGSSSISDDTLDKVRNQLEHYADRYEWWPVAKLALTFSF